MKEKEIPIQVNRCILILIILREENMRVLPTGYHGTLDFHLSQETQPAFYSMLWASDNSIALLHFNMPHFEIIFPRKE